jgi:hypothetical protein
MGWTELLTFLGVLFGGVSALFGGVSAFYARITFQRDSTKQHKNGEASPDLRYRAGDVHGSRLWKYGVVVGVACILLAGFLLIIHPGVSSPPASGPQPTPSSRGSSSSGGAIPPSSPKLSATEYMPLWNKSVAISLFGDGVAFQQNGAPLTFLSDITYGGKWGVASGSLDEWISNSTPSPSDCAHEQGVNTANGTAAVMGARYCYVNTGSPNENGPIVVVLTVTGTSQVGVTFDAQAWAPKS